MKISFSDETPEASQEEQRNCLQIRISQSMSLSARHVPIEAWPRRHVWLAPTHEPTRETTSSGSLCLPQRFRSTTSHNLFTPYFFLMSTRWNASFVTLKCSASSGSTASNASLINGSSSCSVSSSCAGASNSFLNHRQQIVVTAIWKTVTKQQIVAPLHLDCPSRKQCPALP